MRPALENFVEHFWKFDDLSVYDTGDMKAMNKEDMQIIKLWKKNKRKEGGNYQLPIPFKLNCKELHNNKSVTLARLNLLKEKNDGRSKL